MGKIPDSEYEVEVFFYNKIISEIKSKIKI